MKTILTLIMIAVASVATASETTFKLVKAYHPMERSRTLISHHDAILTGRTGTVSEGGNFVEEFYPSSLEMTASVKLDHGIRSLQEIDHCRVLAAGTSRYSIINFCTDSYNFKSYDIGRHVVAHVVAYGGNDRIVAFEPNSGIMVAPIGKRFKVIGKKISLTQSITTYNGKAWFANYMNLYTVDLKTGSRQEVFPNNHDYYGLKYSMGVQFKNSHKQIAAVSRDSQKLILVDAETLQVDGELKLDAEDPEGITRVGECLAITDSTLKKVMFVASAESGLAVIDTWDASIAGDQLKQPSQIAWDANTEQLFLRSSYPCPTCSVTQSSLVMIKAKDLSNLSQCF